MFCASALLFSILNVVFTYPTGAPEKACYDATPMHGVRAVNMAADRRTTHQNCPYLLNALPFRPGVPHTCKLMIQC